MGGQVERSQCQSVRSFFPDPVHRIKLPDEIGRATPSDKNDRSAVAITLQIGVQSTWKFLPPEQASPELDDDGAGILPYHHVPLSASARLEQGPSALLPIRWRLRPQVSEKADQLSSRSDETLGESTREELAGSCHDDDLRVCSGERSSRRVQEPREETFLERPGESDGVVSGEGLSVVAEGSRQSVAACVERRGTAIGRCAILGVLGDTAERRRTSERGREDLGQARRPATVRSAIGQSAERSAPNAGVDELARLQALGVGATTSRD